MTPPFCIFQCITYGKQEQPSPNAAAMLAQQHQQSQAVFAPQSATNLSSGVQSAGAVAVGSAPTAVGAPSAPGSGSASSAAAAALHISNSVAQAANTQQVRISAFCISSYGENVA